MKKPTMKKLHFVYCYQCQESFNIHHDLDDATNEISCCPVCGENYIHKGELTKHE